MPFTAKFLGQFPRTIFIQIANDEAFNDMLLLQCSPGSHMITAPVARSNNGNALSHGRANSVPLKTVSTRLKILVNMGRFDVVGVCRSTMGVRILAALRDLDPPVGGAEMSLATLLKGVSILGHFAEDAPDYIPLEPSEDSGTVEGWNVKVFQSSDRGGVTSLTEDSQLERAVCTFAVEDLWSGLAWRLRNRSSGRPNIGFQRRHLRGVNHKFSKWFEGCLEHEIELAKVSGDLLLGVTQLHWSAGAARTFQKYGIPYLVFVRDELQFDHPDLYKSSLVNATAVCGAGLGLLKQIDDAFSIQKGAHVPLPVDYAGRFGTAEEVVRVREQGLASRTDSDVPRIAIIGVTPEKGYGFYQRLLPYMAEAWPEARFDIYGGGGYVEGLARFGNATCHGHTPVIEVFANCDIHLLTVRSTGSWGRVINEAGLFGVPSVSVNIGAQPEAVGEGGIIVPANADMQAWCEALKHCYANREELGLRAKEHAKVIDHRRSIAMFRSVIRDALGL
ncbi:MAG TPA: glycosyltransferase [Candidatus Poseidoniales archaeon]|nr:MAG TPA: glycosyltransferase [Candidatus Poseidoniales archaeon]